MTLKPTPLIRTASSADLHAIVRVINVAFLSEAFCVAGDRTDADDIRARFATGIFFVIDDPSERMRLLGSVFCSVEHSRGNAAPPSPTIGATILVPAHRDRPRGVRDSRVNVQPSRTPNPIDACVQTDRRSRKRRLLRSGHGCRRRPCGHRRRKTPR